MKRVAISLEAIANRDNLVLALHKAAMGKRHRPEVAQFLQAVDSQLSIKPTLQIQSSHQGITYCGFRITPGSIRLSRRRKRSYQERRQFWEQRYQDGVIDDVQLQTAYAAVHAIIQGADSLGWRRENLRRHPPPTV